MDINILKHARRFAHNGHAGQFRKDGITPYITHPENVLSIYFCHIENYITNRGTVLVGAIACLFHDLKEDTDISINDMISFLEGHGCDPNYATDIGDIVELLTVPDHVKKKDKNQYILDKIAGHSISIIQKLATIVKACDRLDNCLDFVASTGTVNQSYLGFGHELTQDLPSLAYEFSKLDRCQK